LDLGDVLPDGVFRDHCDEGVRLHDFKGTYVMLVFGATDCGPCQDEAPELAELEEWANAEGYGVTVVTLLAAKLSETAHSPDRAELDAWRTGYGLAGPVLADRGYGGALLTRNFGNDYGIPGFMLFAPDLTMLGSQSGSYRTVATVKDLIRAHAAAQP
jgi:thiol-disulfide isomerase/thioredoxin